MHVTLLSWTCKSYVMLKMKKLYIKFPTNKANNMKWQLNLKLLPELSATVG